MDHRSRLFLGILAASTVLAGAACERGAREARQPQATTAQSAPSAQLPQTRSVTNPAPEAAVIASAHSKPADVEAPTPFLLIDGLALQFPPTKLLLRERDGKVIAELSSDLPKSALRNYTGNELYLEMTLSKDEQPFGSTDAKEVDGALWRFKSTTSEKSDSPNGIFLNDQATHLQPSDVMIKVERRGGEGEQPAQLFVQIVGQFRAYESDTPDGLAPFVTVSGELPVEMVPKR